MSSNATETEVVVKTAPKAGKKLKPARKQVKPGEVEKVETPQTGKEYSTCYPQISPTTCVILFARYLVQ